METEQGHLSPNFLNLRILHPPATCKPACQAKTRQRRTWERTKPCDPAKISQPIDLVLVYSKDFASARGEGSYEAQGCAGCDLALAGPGACCQICQKEVQDVQFLFLWLEELTVLEALAGRLSWQRSLVTTTTACCRSPRTSS